jgi:hypothetical protein
MEDGLSQFAALRARYENVLSGYRAFSQRESEVALPSLAASRARVSSKADGF